MNRSLIYAGCMAAVTALAVACGSTSTNVNVTSNANHANANYSNSNGSMMGNASNTMGNAANSVSNSVGSMTTPSPESFLSDTAEGGMTEVELGKLAQTKSKNPDIKKFGQMLVEDHSKANAEVKSLAAKKNINLPTGMGSHQSTFDKLKGLSGDDFDKEFVEDMVDDHEKDVSTFQKESQNSSDPDVKAFAAKTLPVLQKHLDTVKGIQSKMKD
jgi:putative membrane protein